MKRPEPWAFPHEALYRAEIEARLAEDGYRTQRLMGAAILLMQVVMIAIFAVREGGPFATPRRTGYVSLYAVLIVFTVAFLLLQRHMPLSRTTYSSSGIPAKTSCFFSL